MTNLIKTGIEQIDKYEIIKNGEVTLFVYMDKHVILSPDLIMISLLKNLILNKNESVAIVNCLENQDKLREYILELIKVFDINSYSWEKFLVNSFYRVPFLNFLVTNKKYSVEELEIQLKILNKLPEILILLYSENLSNEFLLKLKTLAQNLGIAICIFMQPDYSKSINLYQIKGKIFDLISTTREEKLKFLFENQYKKLLSNLNVVMLNDKFTYDQAHNEIVLLDIQILANTKNQFKRFTLPKEIISSYAEFERNLKGT